MTSTDTSRTFGVKPTHSLGGAADRAGHAAQDVYGQAKDAAVDAAEVVRRGAMDAEDYVRKTIEERPYTVAFAALCLGWFLGRMGRREY
jgi:hypothetical protein